MAAGKGAKGLAALLAAAGIYQIVDWVRAGVSRARGSGPGAGRAAGAGEVHLDIAGERWDLIADINQFPGQVCWLLVQGPHTQVAAATAQPGGPLAFSLEPGPPGTYRFWLFSSGKRKETVRSLLGKTSRAVAAGEFRVSS